MPDANHFDLIAMRHGDGLTRWFEDAVDEADAEAGHEVEPVPVVPQRGEQVGPVPEAPKVVQPERAQ